MFVKVLTSITVFTVVSALGTPKEKCARRLRFDCLPDDSDKTACPLQCNKCSQGFPIPRRCVTKHRACIFANRNKLTQYTTKETCEAAPSAVWCDGDSVQECVETQPIREECFKRISRLVPCDKDHSTQKSCQEDGCIWCGVGTAGTKDKCFKLSSSLPKCDSTRQCCPQLTCFPGNVSPSDCSEKGCRTCDDDGKTRCNFVGEDTPTPPVSDKWSDCSLKCGGGTRFRLVECTDRFDPETCKKEYGTCNADECPLPSGYCKKGVIARYNDNRMCCIDHTDACGFNMLNDPQRRFKRIVGGKEIEDNVWKWMGVVYGKSKICPATLVSYTHAVSTKSCIEGINQEDMLFHRVNDRTLRPYHKSKIASVNIYGQFATLKLDEVIDPWTTTSKPICLPNGEEPLTDRRCVVTGWGSVLAVTSTSTGDSNSCTAKLNEGNVRILPWTLCEQAWKEVNFGKSHNYICAGIPEGEPDACSGDAGAPLMCQRCDNCGWYLAGIATDSLGCGVKGKPTVYYKITSDYTDKLSFDFEPLDDRSYSSCKPH